MSTSHKTYAEDALSDFSSDYLKSTRPTGLLMYSRKFLGKMMENMQADFIQSQQEGFERCCLIDARRLLYQILFGTGWKSFKNLRTYITFVFISKTDLI